MENEAKELIARQDELYVVEESFRNMTSISRFDTMWTMCERLAKMPMLPARYRNRPDQCFLALNMSLRLGEDFMLVTQEMSEVYGKPTMSAKWQLARLNRSGFLRGGLRYVWSGQESLETTCCYAVGTRASDGEELRGQMASWKQAEAMRWTKRPSKSTGKNESLWPKMPILMIHNRAATFWISMHASHVTAGYIETQSAIDAGPDSAGAESPYAVGEDAEDADWRDIPEDAEPSPEDAVPPARENVGPTAVPLDPGHAVTDWEDAYDEETARHRHGPEGNDTDDRAAGQDSISKMELE